MIDELLEALGDRTRRRIVGRLGYAPSTVTELARSLPVGRPAVSMHLRVLRDAGLVSRKAEGTRRIYQLEPSALAAVRDCLDWYLAHASVSRDEQSAQREQAPPPEREAHVGRSIVVELNRAQAFERFLRHEVWQPSWDAAAAIGTGKTTLVIEQFVGGRCYERKADGGERDWGRVTAFEPPHRVVLAWNSRCDAPTVLERSVDPEIDLHFLVEDRDRTRVVVEHRFVGPTTEENGKACDFVGFPEAAEALIHSFERAARTTTERPSRDSSLLFARSVDQP